MALEFEVHFVLDAGADHGALEIGEGGEHLEHQLAHRAAGSKGIAAHIDDMERDAKIIEKLGRVEEVAGVATQAVQLGEDDVLDGILRPGQMADGGRQARAPGALEEFDRAGSVGVRKRAMRVVTGEEIAFEAQIIIDPGLLGVERRVLLGGGDATIDEGVHGKKKENQRSESENEPPTGLFLTGFVQWKKSELKRRVAGRAAQGGFAGGPRCGRVRRRNGGRGRRSGL